MHLAHELTEVTVPYLEVDFIENFERVVTDYNKLFEEM